MSSKTELCARKDKAALMNTGRLMERRFDREHQEHQAEIQELQTKLEEAQREATMAKGGGGAMKELQKELADLRVTLAETEAELVGAKGERDAAMKERDDVLAGRPGAPQAVARQAADRVQQLEDEVKQLRKKVGQADEEYVKVSAASSGGNGATLAALEAKVQEMEAKSAAAQNDASKAVEGLADLKVQLAQVEELKTRESQRRTRQLKHAEERAERMREELITVWEASNRGQFSDAGKNKFVTKALDLEQSLQTAQKRIVQLEDKGIEGKLAASEKVAKRFYELLEFLRISEDDADKLVKDGIAWPAQGAGPQNLLELMAALGTAPPPPTPAPAPVVATPPPPPKEEPKPKPKPISVEEASQIKKLEATIEKLKGKITALEQSAKTKSDEIVQLEQDRQSLEDEVARQKSKMLLAERDAQERGDELIQLKGRKDKEATELEKERTKLKHEVDRQKRRAEDALAENKKIISDGSAQFAQLEKERDEAEASLARLVERQDRTKAEHEATMNQLVARIQAFETAGAGAGAGAPKDASGRALEKERTKHQSDLAFFHRQVEELRETARIKEQEHGRQMESKIQELEHLESERDRYRDEVAAAREAVSRAEARVSKPMSRGASRAASPAPPATPEQKPARSDSGEELAWLQQQKLAVVETLEKERARLEGELASQTQIAEEALMEAGTQRAELEQLRAAKATDAGEWDSERHRLEVELGSQATLALERARELDAERERMAGLVRQLSELEKERNTLRTELSVRENNHGFPSLHSKVVGAQLDGNVAPGAFPDRSMNGTPVSAAASLAQSFITPQAMPSFGSPIPSAAGAPGAQTPAVSGPVRLLVEHLRKTNRELHQEVIALKDENMTMMMRLAGL